MNNMKSDLIIEYDGCESSVPLHSPEHAESEMMGFKVVHSLHGENSYYTAVCGRIWLSASEERKRLLRLLAKLIGEYVHPLGAKTVLAVGLGSPSVTADSLGSLAASRIVAADAVMQEMGLPKVCVTVPGVPAKTGLDTAATVRCIAADIRADLIITVDSLCALSSNRLGTVVQITDMGVTPGSAFSHTSGEISRRTMPCPVVSVGVPTVIRAETLSAFPADRGLLVSPADTDLAVDCYASIIAGAINSSLMGNTPV